MNFNNANSIQDKDITIEIEDWIEVNQNKK